MKKIASALLILAGAGAAFAYWIDLVNFTDMSRGFCTTGSIWLRYAVLAVLLLIGALASRMASKRPAALEHRCVPMAAAGLLCTAAYAALGGIQLAVWWLDGGKTSIQTMQAAPTLLLALFLGVFSLLTAWWMACQGRLWASDVPRRPVAGVGFGALGCLYFLLLTCVRFATNSSSLYRFAQTVGTFSALAALGLVSLLLRVCFFPESGCGRKLYLTGIWAFYLCTCFELPQALARWITGQTEFSDLAFSVALGCIGILGAVCAQASLSKEKADETTDEGA